MDNVTKIVKQATFVLMFCLAITYLFWQYSSYLGVVKASNDMMTEDVMYEKYNEVKDITFTKGEIILFIISELEYDVEIEGLLISKHENVKENIEHYVIDEDVYVRTYGYDVYGNITRIIFHKYVVES